LSKKQLSIIRTTSGNVQYVPEAITTQVSGQHENSAEIKYGNHKNDIEIISVSDKKDNTNIIYEQNNADTPVNYGNQTNSADDDARLQSHVRNRFVNIPNAEKPLQTNTNGNDDATVGSSNNETYSE